MNLTQTQFSKVIVKSISCMAIAIENEKKLKIYTKIACDL